MPWRGKELGQHETDSSHSCAVSVVLAQLAVREGAGSCYRLPRAVPGYRGGSLQEKEAQAWTARRADGSLRWGQDG